jgi:uncharacterized protein YaeQ
MEDMIAEAKALIDGAPIDRVRSVLEDLTCEDVDDDRVEKLSDVEARAMLLELTIDDDAGEFAAHLDVLRLDFQTP